MQSDLVNEKLQSEINLINGEKLLLQAQLNYVINEKLRLAGLMTSRGIFEQILSGIGQRELVNKKRKTTTDVCNHI